MSRFQVLSIDGGGLRGIFAASVLEMLARDFKTDVVSHFDLIVGTSTGGLIALALAAGHPPREILDFYLKNGQKIFPRTPTARIRRAVRPYDPDPLRQALESIFGDARLGDSSTRLVIPAFDLTSNDVYLFRTPHSPRLRRDERETMVNVALATTAAPTFFPAFRMEGLRLIDGGIWANNPTMVGVVEALAACDAPREDVHILSLGTTDPVVRRPRRLDSGLPVWWIRPIVDVVLRGQAKTATNHAGLLLPEGNVHRIDIEVPAGLHRLDHVDKDALIGIGRTVSRRAAPGLADVFQHAASPYRGGDDA